MAALLKNINVILKIIIKIWKWTIDLVESTDTPPDSVVTCGSTELVSVLQLLKPDTQKGVFVLYILDQ